ncbi:MAG TPA: Slp family lipoprotein, partial [Saprospiraceae bacterium]|nr:Slp family lipoprotein [Saprospiraceae bacterium]
MRTLLLIFCNNVRRSTCIVITLGGAALLLNACTPVISPQLMDQVDRSLTYSSLASRPDESTGKIVLLGGTIVQTVPKPGETEIEVVQKDLLSSGEPRLTDKSEGRFLVVVDRFLDPAIYQPGRGLTVAGKVQSSVVRRIGEIDYRYPVIAGEELHLWRDPPPYYNVPYAYPIGYPWWWWRYP